MPDKKWEGDSRNPFRPTWKHWLILFLVGFNFLVGFISSVPGYYYIRHIPYINSIIGVYDYLGFRQNWNMFSPPPKVNETIQLAFITSKGWGPLIEPFQKERENYSNSALIVPRGLTRLITFLRSSNSDRTLDKNRMRKFFFQELSDYYCFGKGKIEDLISVRFYLTTKALPYFYPNDIFGDPLPKESQFDGTMPIYERMCSEQ